MLTPIDNFGKYWVKREDKAGWINPDYPSGSKVRQYAAMAQPNVPMIVGCSSTSAMQIYVAAAAKQNQVPGIIYVSKCKEPTEATQYAKEMGAEIVEVKPGYMNVVRSKARARAIELGKTVKWDVKRAIADAAVQVENLPSCRRIVVATGSGLSAAGVLAGLALRGLDTPVVAVAVSPLASVEGIIGAAMLQAGATPIKSWFRLILHPMKYTQPLVKELPDGTPLDPFYAAKALSFVQDGDVLWIPGLRPVRSMPKECREAFKNWKGF
jgi:hypothetical protein